MYFFQYREVLGRTPEPGLVNCEGLEDEKIDDHYINSPKTSVSKDAFRPQNFLEKAALNRGWLDSSRYKIYDAAIYLTNFWQLY